MAELLNFKQSLQSPWKLTHYGSGHVTTMTDSLHLSLPVADATHYHDAQLSDYASKVDFRWQPPLRMEVIARCEVPMLSNPQYPLVGTAGFGFWNHPFVPGERGLRLPKAVWFFFSAPPSNMRLAQGVAGPGWKAATIDATRWQFAALAPTAPIGLLLMRVPALYRRLWSIGQRAIGVSEHPLDSSLLLERHTYRLDWQPDIVHFAVDDVTVHQAHVSIRGPLGFIAWVDNQYAVVTPQGNFQFGVVNVPRQQTLILDKISFEGNQPS